MTGRSGSEAEVEWAPGEALEFLVRKMRSVQLQPDRHVRIGSEAGRFVLRDIAVLRRRAEAAEGGTEHAEWLAGAHDRMIDRLDAERARVRRLRGMVVVLLGALSAQGWVIVALLLGWV